MKVIILVGPKNSGKTTTIKEVCHQLTAQGAVIVSGDPAITQTQDTECLLMYKDRKIHFCSCGDKPTDAFEYAEIDQYETDNDILVCASNPGFKTLAKDLSELEEEYYRVDKLEATAADNERCKNLILIHINNIIKLLL